MSKKTTWLGTILWAVFLIGMLEIIFFLKLDDNLIEMGLISLLLFGSIMITSVKTYQPKIGYYHELLPYLIHPLFLFVGTIGFIIFNNNPYLEQVTIIFTTIAYLILFSENFSDLTHKAHDAVKFLIIFYLYFNIFEAVNYFSLNHYFIIVLFALTSLFFFLHMLWRLKELHDSYLFLCLIFSFVLGIIAYTLSIYYFLASFLILAIIVLTLYYVFWGILHHHIEKNLTFQVLIEYILVAGIILSMFMGLITGW